MRISHLLGAALLAAATLAQTAHGASTIDDLRITEVRPDTDQVEVTHTGTDSITTATALTFCHSFLYSSSILAGTTFDPGQSRVYSIVGLNDVDSDIWLYRDMSFDSPSSIITGMKYGPAANVGRMSVAQAAGIWPSTTAFVPVPVAGESLQAVAFDTTDPDSWASATPDFGVFFGTGTPITDPLPAIPKGSLTIGLELVMDGLISPLGVVDPSDGTDRLFIYDQAGTVSVVENGTPLPTPFLDVGSRLVPLGAFGPGSFDERGFIGFAVHPNFTSNPRVYTYTSEPVSATATVDFTNTAILASQDHQAVISEWTVDSLNPNQVDPTTRRELLRINEPQFNHDGGTLRFGPDGFLYIALGDGGNRDDEGTGHLPDGNAQDPTNVYGSILRIDVDGNSSANGQYGIPVDNPFVGSAGLDEVYLHGLRNPFMYSFDRLNGDLYIGDAGQNFIEEIDRVTSADAGGNLGWRHKEGSFFFDPAGTSPGFITSTPASPVPSDLIDPLAEYDHGDGVTTDNGTAVIGGFVYRGTDVPDLDGVYVFGDFGTSFGVPSGRLWYLDSGNEIRELIINDDAPLGYWLKGFGQDSNGEIYICGSRAIGPFEDTVDGPTGVVFRITTPLVTPVAGWSLYR